MNRLGKADQSVKRLWSYCRCMHGLEERGEDDVHWGGMTGMRGKNELGRNLTGV